MVRAFGVRCSLFVLCFLKKCRVLFAVNRYFGSCVLCVAVSCFGIGCLLSFVVSCLFAVVVFCCLMVAVCCVFVLVVC